MLNRNPIARNAWKFNKRKVIPPKKGKGSVYKRDRAFSRALCQEIR